MAIDKVLIFDVPDVQASAGRPTRARGDGVSSRAARAFEASAATLEQSLVGFVETMREMLGKIDDAAGVYHLDTVEVAAEISTEGKVGFVGVGLGAQASSSMKILFKRASQ